MKDSKVWIRVVGVVCGIELLVIAVVGGVGVGAFFGLEGALVASIMAGSVVVALRSLTSHRSPMRNGHTK